MKDIFNRLFLLLTAVGTVVSCVEQEHRETTGLAPMTFMASAGGDPDSKTVYDRGAVLWSEEDKITVFSAGAQGQAFSATELYEGGQKAEFSGMADPAAGSWTAVYPHSEDNAYNEGVLSVNIPAQQTAFAGGFAPQANVSVAYSTDQTLLFRNVSALIPFRFGTETDAQNTKKVTFKVRKTETEFFNIAGDTDVTIGADGVPSVSEGSIDNVVLNAPEGGFEADVTYYVPVCPVGETAGLLVSFTDSQERITERELGMNYAFERNTIVDLVCVSDLYLPTDFTITLDFALGWPFSTPIATEQVKGGETYYYTLQTGDESLNIPVVIDGNGSPYSYTENQYITFGVNGAGIKAPAFTDRYLTGVKAYKTRLKRLVLPSGEASPWYIRWYDWSLYEDKSMISYEVETEPGTFDSYEDIYTKTSAKNMSYTVKVREADAKVTKVEFIYSSTSPGNAPED